MRLNTPVSFVSRQKYPVRTNWNRSPGAAFSNAFSITQPCSVVTLLPVEIVVEGLPLRDGAGVLDGEQLIEHAHIRAETIVRRDPVDRALDLAAVGRRAVAAFEVGGADDLFNAAVGVPDDVLISDDIRAHQPHLAVGLQAEVLGRRIHRKVLRVDVQIPRESDRPRTGIGVVRVVGQIETLHLSLGIVLDLHADRREDGDAAGRRYG